MDRLRLPFFIVALIFMVIVVLLEVGGLFIHSGPPNFGAAAMEAHQPIDADLIASMQHARDSNSSPPGLGIPYLVLIDGVLLFTILLEGLSLIIRENLQGRIQGIATLIFSIIVILGGIAMIFAALNLLLFMVALLLATPFGTLAYLVLFGFFDTGGAAILLSLIMFCKIVFAVCLVLAQQRFLQAKGLVVMIVISLVANIVVGFLQGFPPGFLVSITDAIAAIIVGIVGVILAIVLLIFAIVAVVKAIQLNRDLVA